MISEERIRMGCDTHDVAYTNVHSVRGNISGDGFVSRKASEDVDEKSASGVVESGPEGGRRRKNVETSVDVDVHRGGGNGFRFASRGHSGRKEKER